ncbi:MAG: hypothetical protein AAGN35_10920 [Bacteroidota bacterium]
MKSLTIFLYEATHFVRNPFKVVAVLLFVLASGYGLHNGARLYQEQTAEIARIQDKIAEDRQEYRAYYDAEQPGPENAPWINMEEPFWAIWFNYIHHFKSPSPALVYSVGQAEQYGYYKRVTFWASPYDDDMTQEIANPERLQAGTLDFSFALLFLLPLLLLILLYNLKSTEAEQGLLPLIEVQTAGSSAWLLSRTAFYVSLLFLVTLGLLVYGAMLTGVFSQAGAAFGQMLLFSALYLLVWAVGFYLILRTGKSVLGNTLKMVGIWLIFAFIVPAAVHQWISIERPANLMTDLIDAKRDERQALFELPDSVYRGKLHALFPEILDSPLAKDSLKLGEAYNSSAAALVNELVKRSIVSIEADSEAKNKLARTSHWLNPIAFFQNRFNQISQSHFDDYQAYRNEIQALIDQQIRTLVLDIWKGVKVDKSKFEEYYATLNLE